MFQRPICQKIQLLFEQLFNQSYCYFISLKSASFQLENLLQLVVSLHGLGQYSPHELPFGVEFGPKSILLTVLEPDPTLFLVTQCWTPMLYCPRFKCPTLGIWGMLTVKCLTLLEGMGYCLLIWWSWTILAIFWVQLGPSPFSLQNGILKMHVHMRWRYIHVYRSKSINLKSFTINKNTKLFLNLHMRVQFTLLQDRRSKLIKLQSDPVFSQLQKFNLITKEHYHKQEHCSLYGCNIDTGNQ